MSHVFGALWSISSKITDKKAIAFYESLKKKSPNVLEKLRLLYETHKTRNTFDDRSFYRYAVDLLCLQTKQSLSIGIFAGHSIAICDTIRGCKCCESFNQEVRQHSLSQAINEIDKMLKDASNSFELFHEFAELAVQNEAQRQANPMSQSLRVADALPVAAAAFPVAVAVAVALQVDSADLPVTDAAALQVDSTDLPDECVMYD
jgi:hypothetical protein